MSPKEQALWGPSKPLEPKDWNSKGSPLMLKIFPLMLNGHKFGVPECRDRKFSIVLIKKERNLYKLELVLC